MQFRHPVLDQRLRLTVRRRGGCWQLRGNLGRWCGPRMSLGYYGSEGWPGRSEPSWARLSRIAELSGGGRHRGRLA